MPLNHVALTVSDRERSAAFYGEHFGMIERVHEDEHLLILGSDDGSLLALSPGSVPVDLPRTNHFGFQLSDGDAVRRVRAATGPGSPRPNGRMTATSSASRSPTPTATGSSCSRTEPARSRHYLIWS